MKDFVIRPCSELAIKDRKDFCTPGFFFVLESALVDLVPIGVTDGLDTYGLSASHKLGITSKSNFAPIALTPCLREPIFVLILLGFAFWTFHAIFLIP
ncbi:MAG: hypothetical protein KKD28_03265 [Chloroflexi bacterium]|nr:hypothetical protein [Chloroflexota bacterium]MBU1660473.1 hypothetical protein [Chloroflexota bacterium]